MLVTTALLALIVILIGVIFYLDIRLNKLTQQVLDLKESEKNLVQPGLNLMQSATHRAQQIITDAEIEAIKIPTEIGIESGLFERQVEERFQQSFVTLTNSLEKNFSQFQNLISASLTSSQQKHDQFLVNLEKQSLDWKNLIEQELKSKIENSLISFEQKIADFFAGAERNSEEAINLELKSARELIESYKAQQLKIVDENIVAVLERTLNIILKEKLTLKDQLDLVYEALEKAKVEKFLI